jgi:NADH:ubiquinone oxidoreductase subunit 2 (subunit N)
MYMQEPGEATASLQPLGAGIRTALWASALGTLILGIFPSLVLNFAQNSSALVK